MGVKVLVAYATKHGSTAEIAERIGQTLRESQLVTVVRPVKEVDDLEVYDAVVLGSAVYIGGWRKEAAKFLQEYADLLSEKRVWLFSSGPTGEGDPQETLAGWNFPAKLQPVAERIAPRDIALFHGELDEDDLNFLEKWTIKQVKAPIGDFRDWEAIDAWAAEIAAALKQEPVESV